MKIKIFKYVLPYGLGLTLSFITLYSILTLSLSSCSSNCSDNEVWCSNGETCCPSDKPYYDGNGHCWVDMGSCRWASDACEICTDEN